MMEEKFAETLDKRDEDASAQDETPVAAAEPEVQAAQVEENKVEE